MLENYGSRIPVDPGVVERIQRSPSMRTEQGGEFMERWGGPTQYKAVAKLGRNQRTAFYAVQEGCKTAEEISVATGLSPEQADQALADLLARGWVSPVAEKL